MSSTWNAGKEASKGARADRYRAIREALGVTQEVFADRLNEAARTLGIEARYKAGDISPRENGRKDLDIEDYTLASHLDPEKRSWFWLAFGREAPNAMKIPRGNSSSRKSADA